MAPPQILEAEHACGVSHVHGAATAYARAAAYGKVCHMYSVAAQCVSLSNAIVYKSSIYRV